MMERIEDQRDSDSSESDFGGMFCEVDSKNCVFYFNRIVIHRNQEENCTQVVFLFSYMHKYTFESRLQIPACVPVDLNKVIFSIGMCHLLWYWMGFGTDVIEINDHHSMSESTRLFWESFYNTVTLEFKYLHPSVGRISLQSVTEGVVNPPFIQESTIPLFAFVDQPNYRQGIMTVTSSSTKVITSPGSSNCDRDHNRDRRSINKVLCPLGGGKDSLVVWRQCAEQNRMPVLLYCCDSLYEFEANWRVQQLARTMQSPLFIGECLDSSVRNHIHCLLRYVCTSVYICITSSIWHLC